MVTIIATTAFKMIATTMKTKVATIPENMEHKAATTTVSTSFRDKMDAVTNE